MSFSILGTGSALPKHSIHNDDFPPELDTSDEWISTRTGIRSRHVLTEESMLALASDAAAKAMDNAGLAAGDIDYILCCTLGGDYLFPSLACLLQAKLGATCPALDVNAACAGFLYGLDVAAGLMAAGRARHILLVAAEGMSRLVDWSDRSTCVLFGDGAAAVVLGAGDDLLYLHLESQGNPEVLYAPYPAGNFPGRPAVPHYAKMNGQEVYKYAVGAISGGIGAALAFTGLAPEGIGHVLLHQANLRIIEAAKKKLPIPHDRYPTNIHRTGNTSAASIPLLLDECRRDGVLQRGENVVLCAFGAGLTSGTAVLRWAL